MELPESGVNWGELSGDAPVKAGLGSGIQTAVADPRGLSSRHHWGKGGPPRFLALNVHSTQLSWRDFATIIKVPSQLP